MFLFVRSALWAVALTLILFSVQVVLDGSTVSAQDPDPDVDAEGGTLQSEDPRLYWKCWRSASDAGAGFTNSARAAGSVFATPDLPATESYTEDVNPNDRWHLTRASLIDARFYRDPDLRELGTNKPKSPADLPLVDATYPASLFDPPNSKYAPSVVKADKRIETVTTIWQTHSGSAGANLIDDAKSAQREQTADQEIADHVVSRQTAYQGPGRAADGRLDPYAPVQNFPELGSDFGTGLRLDTGLQEVPTQIISGTAITQTSGTTTTTQFEVGTRPSLVSAESSVASRNSPTLPEVNQQAVTVSRSLPELHLVAATPYFSATDTDSAQYGQLAASTIYPDGLVPIGPFDPPTIEPGIPVVHSPAGTAHEQLYPTPGCFVAHSVRPDGATYHEIRVYCWMVRAPARISLVGATQELPMFLTGGPAPAHPQQAAHADPAFSVVLNPPAPFVHLALPGSHTFSEVPEYESTPALGDAEGVLTANTPADRHRALAPDVADDSPNDSILVTLELKEDRRRDPTTRYSFQNNSSGERFSWRLFGDETVAPQLRTDANGNLVHQSYRQPYLVPPFWGAGSDPQELLVPYLYDPDDPIVYQYGADTIFRWPVRLDELNYYLFAAPEFTHAHAADLGHVWNLSYSYVTGPPTAQADAWGYAPAPDASATPLPSKVESAPIPQLVDGTSGRTGVLGYGAYHLDPFSPGKAYLPLFDYQGYVDMVNSSYAGYDQAVKTGVYGAAPTLGRDHLLKAGVAAPTDRTSGEDGFGTNSRFQFSIDEGIAVSVPDGTVREDLYSRLGIVPSHVASVAGAQYQDPLLHWPNQRLDPDGTHVLVVTFYEGRLAKRWRLTRSGELRTSTQTGDKGAAQATVDFFVNSAQRGYDLGNELLDYAQGEDVEYAAVPTYQIRRVMCRIIVPPEGVILPASGVEGLKKQIGGSIKGLIDKIKEAFAGLFDWLEKWPQEVMEGGARAAEQGACEGGEFMGSLGDSDVAGTEQYQSPTADAELSYLEQSDLQGRNHCRRVSSGLGAEGTTPCDAVANAVGDPSCSAVPSVDFDQHPGRRADTGIEHRWQFTGGAADTASLVPAYRDDVRLFPDRSFAESYDQVGSGDYGGLGVNLASSILADRGYPSVRFHLPYPVQPPATDLFFDNLNLGSPAPGSSGYATADQLSPPAHFANAANQLPYNGVMLYVRPDPKASSFSSHSYADISVAIAASQGTEDPLDDLVGIDSLLAPPASELRFVLPLYYLQTLQAGTTQSAVRRITTFEMGGVPFQRATPNCRESSVPVLHEYPALGNAPFGGRFDFIPAYPGITDRWACKPVGGLGGPNRQFEHDDEKVLFIGQSDWDVLAGFLDFVWFLGDGFEYEVSLAAYRGWPGLDVGYVEGPRSSWRTIRGGAELACTDERVLAALHLGPGRESDFNTFSTPLSVGSQSPPPTFQHAMELAEHYSCATQLAPGGALSSYGPGSDYHDNFVVVLENAVGGGGIPRVLPRGAIASQVAPDLSGIYRASHLFGSSACGNLWNGTPASLTWDSPIVRTLWHVSWVLALLVFLAVLLWDGLGITWDGMIGDGRGGSALKTMFPRYALAIVLAGLSLFICRIALTLAADVTCFVSHATGMTFWGFLGTMLGGTLGHAAGAFGPMLLLMIIPGVGTIVFTAFLLIIFTVLLFVIWYAIKLFFAMVGRIVLLLVLCGISPIAFAMMASPVTSHWTKRWVSMFLGTAFQQVAVLFVLYGGAAIATQFSGSDVGGGLFIWNMFIILLLALLTMFLASQVPNIVNPSSRGLMSGFGQALGMVAGAAMIAATAGAGLAGGMLAGMGGGGAGGNLLGGVSRLVGAGAGGGPGGGATPAPGAAGGASNTSNSPMVAAASNYGSDAGGATGFMTGGDPSNFQSPSQTPTPPSVGAGGGGDPAGGSGPAGGGARETGGSGVNPQAAASAAQNAASTPGGGGAGGFRSRMGGFFDRAARGAYYGAVRGQDISGSMQRVMRHGDVSAVPLRGYNRSRPIDTQTLRDYVNRRPIEQDPEALRRMAEARGTGFGGGARGPGGGRRGRDDDDHDAFQTDPGHDDHDD